MTSNNILTAGTIARTGLTDSMSPEDRQKLTDLAAEFESLLLSQMLRDMTESGKWSQLGDKGLDTLGAETFDKTFQQELSRYLAKSGGLGLSQQLLKALDALSTSTSPASSSASMLGAIASSSSAAASAAAAGFERMPEDALVNGRPADMNDPYDVFHYHIGTGAPNPARNTQAEKDYYANVIKPMFDAYGMASELMPASGSGIHDTIRVQDPRTGHWREVDILGESGTWWGESGGVPGLDAPMPMPTAAALAAGARPAPQTASELSVPSAVVTSNYGWRQDPFTGETTFHKGVDLRASEGSAVKSAGAGRVTFSGANGGYGTTVIVQHANGLSTRYAHLSEALVHLGEEISDQQVIGRAGQTGRATAAHLHFEVLEDGVPVDPLR
jgi:murein DD-endopeptidase MepM/ murein hydrolase activator NlpD/Rod binding domain-containing protein